MDHLVESRRDHVPFAIVNTAAYSFDLLLVAETTLGTGGGH